MTNERGDRKSTWRSDVVSCEPRDAESIERGGIDRRLGHFDMPGRRKREGDINHGIERLPCSAQGSRQRQPRDDRGLAE